jgi:hypothetical protein
MAPALQHRASPQLPWRTTADQSAVTNLMAKYI